MNTPSERVESMGVQIRGLKARIAELEATLQSVRDEIRWNTRVVPGAHRRDTTRHLREGLPDVRAVGRQGHPG